MSSHFRPTREVSLNPLYFLLKFTSHDPEFSCPQILKRTQVIYKKDKILHRNVVIFVRSCVGTCVCECKGNLFVVYSCFIELR